jgi:hypothetical protein
MNLLKPRGVNTAKADRTMTAQSEKSIICKKPRLTALYAGIVLTPPLTQRRLDSQLGEHLDQSDCAISSCSHEAFGIENLHRAHKYRFFSYCYANCLGNFTRYYFYNSQSTHWNGILKGKRHFPVYFDLSLRRNAVAM